MAQSPQDKAIINGMEPDTGYSVPVNYWSQSSGLTKREYFAAMAMQGIMSNQKLLENLDEIDGGVAGHAVRHADALLLELEKTAQ